MFVHSFIHSIFFSQSTGVGRIFVIQLPSKYLFQMLFGSEGTFVYEFLLFGAFCVSSNCHELRQNLRFKTTAGPSEKYQGFK